MYYQEPPFAMQIELVEGCQLRCPFCGLSGIREPAPAHDYKMMTLDTAKSVADQIREARWNSRIEFAMHGEPTMHSNPARMVQIFRSRLRKHQLMMTSNGGGLLKPPGVIKNLQALFKAGLNIFAFDAYEYVKIKDKVDEALEKWETMGLLFDVHRYPDEREYSPHNRYGHKAKIFIRVKDISVAEVGTHSDLNNHCGAGSEPLEKPMLARCAKPFREMSVRWDGSVAICCNDWRGVYKCGNAVKDRLQDIWNGDEFKSARRFLIKGERGALKPCNVCDAKSYRVGLLPDKFGKKRLREPDEHDRMTVKMAAKGEPYTQAILRPWDVGYIEPAKVVVEVPISTTVEREVKVNRFPRIIK